MNQSFFSRVANATARGAGQPVASILAVSAVIIWACTGPWFDFGETWQLVINTGTTIVTFLMVFLIQNTQNRDTQALQIKLDELIRATQGAHNALLDMEEREEQDLQEVQESYENLAQKARHCAPQDDDDAGTPEVPSQPATS